MLVEAFGENAMSQSKTFLWCKRFKDGRTSVEDDERSGRSSTSTTPENIAKVRRNLSPLFKLSTGSFIVKF
jgi:hypothetical protein